MRFRCMLGLHKWYFVRSYKIANDLRLEVERCPFCGAARSEYTGRYLR